MSLAFNADEIFEMAEQLERNGAKFYRSAAERSLSPEAKRLVLNLAAMEDEHEKTFKAMRKELTAKEREATVFDPEGEAGLYLRALVDSRVFFEKKIDLTSIVEVLKAAIEAEKESIMFYIGMRDVVPERLGRKRVDDIIKEEMGHVRLLTSELMALKKK